LKKRYLFSEVNQFVLYDFITDYSHINENVFAYSNGYGDEKAIVLYNNKFEDTSGLIKFSCAAAAKENGKFKNFTISEILGVSGSDNKFVIYRDSCSNLEYIRHSNEIMNDGLKIQLGAFKYYVFIDFRQVVDNEYGHYAQLNSYLNGRGVPDIKTALKETFLQPILNSFREIVNNGFISFVEKSQKEKEKLDDAYDQYTDKLENLFRETLNFYNTDSKYDTILENSTQFFKNYLSVELKDKKFPALLINNFPSTLSIIGGLTVYSLGLLIDSDNPSLRSIALYDEMLLSKIIRETESKDKDPEKTVLLVKAVSTDIYWFDKLIKDANKALRFLFSNPAVSSYLKVNRYREILYFDKENFEQLITAYFTIFYIRSQSVKMLICVESVQCWI